MPEKPPLPEWLTNLPRLDPDQLLRQAPGIGLYVVEKNPATGRSEIRELQALAELGRIQELVRFADLSDPEPFTTSSAQASDLTMENLLHTMESLRSKERDPLVEEAERLIQRYTRDALPPLFLFEAPREIKMEPRPPEEHPFFFQPQFIVRNPTLPLCCFPATADPPEISAEDGMRLVVKWAGEHGLIARICRALEEGWL